MQITQPHSKTHWLALTGATLRGVAEFLALCRSRWSQTGGPRR